MKRLSAMGCAISLTTSAALLAASGCGGAAEPGSDAAIGGACTAIALGGPSVPESAGAGTFPTAAGGTIVPGTYHLSEWAVYPPGSVDAYQRRETFVYGADGTIENVTQRFDGTFTEARGTWSTSGTELTLDVSCPGAATYSFPYTATETTLTWIVVGDGLNEVRTYVRE